MELKIERHIIRLAESVTVEEIIEDTAAYMVRKNVDTMTIYPEIYEAREQLEAAKYGWCSAVSYVADGCYAENEIIALNAAALLATGEIGETPHVGASDKLHALIYEAWRKHSVSARSEVDDEDEMQIVHPKWVAESESK